MSANHPYLQPQGVKLWRAQLRGDRQNAYERHLRLPPNGHAWSRSTAPRPDVWLRVDLFGEGGKSEYPEKNRQVNNIINTYKLHNKLYDVRHKKTPRWTQLSFYNSLLLLLHNHAFITQPHESMHLKWTPKQQIPSLKQDAKKHAFTLQRRPWFEYSEALAHKNSRGWQTTTNVLFLVVLF